MVKRSIIIGLWITGFLMMTNVYAQELEGQPTANAAGAQTQTQSPSDPSVARFQAWLEKQNQRNNQSLESATTKTPAKSADVSTTHFSGESQSHTGQLQNDAFNQMTSQAMPLTPEQIIKFRKMMQQTQVAAATYPDSPPKPVSSTLVVNLAPGSTPPAIRLYEGFISSLVFVDSSGAPWPIVAYDLGNSRAFNIQWDKKSNILMIQPQRGYIYANLAVQLKGLSTPVMLTLVPGQSTVDYRVDLRVNGLGPNAQDSGQSASLTENADPMLLSVLDGVPPSGSRTLSLEKNSGQVWLTGDTMYVRTRFTLLSPGWLDVMTSPDGMHAYKLQKTPSVLVSRYGKPMELKVEGE
ncbi:MAG: DotH/IcmK family type IV secretion protein [Gammaproteobacteria bacterium]